MFIEHLLYFILSWELGVRQFLQSGCLQAREGNTVDLKQLHAV